MIINNSPFILSALNNSLFIIAPIVIVAILILAILNFGNFVTRQKKKKGEVHKDHNKVLKNASKRLQQNPRDPEALFALADLYYKDGVYDKAYKNYSILIDLCATHPDLNEEEITLNLALCALKLKNYEEAYKGLILAKTMIPNDFNVNYNLGFMEYTRGNFEKASIMLSQANTVNPDHVQTTRLLGHSLFKIERYKDAFALLEKAIEYEPDDKDSLFALGQCNYEMGKHEKSLLIFTHLRTDPKLGPHASLIAGTINLGQKSFTKAIMDFEIGLRHTNIETKIMLELKYRLAATYIKMQKIDRALALLREIKEIQQDYKDINDQIAKYQELDANKYLQIFLIAPTSEFVTLCRKIAQSYHDRSRTKIIDISLIKNEYTDILTEVNTKKWEDLVLFRFIRSSSVTGELTLREMYSRCKELKAGKGFCITAGTYSETAKQFVEARLIDLIEKNDLIKLFEKLSR